MLLEFNRHASAACTLVVVLVSLQWRRQDLLRGGNYVMGHSRWTSGQQLLDD